MRILVHVPNLHWRWLSSFSGQIHKQLKLNIFITIHFYYYHYDNYNHYHCCYHYDYYYYYFYFLSISFEKPPFEVYLQLFHCLLGGIRPRGESVHQLYHVKLWGPFGPVSMQALSHQKFLMTRSIDLLKSRAPWVSPRPPPLGIVSYRNNPVNRASLWVALSI